MKPLPLALGLDLSLTYPGFALLLPDGSARRTSELSLGSLKRRETVAAIRDELVGYMGFRPDLVVIESNAGIRNWHGEGKQQGAATLDALGFVRGVVWGILAELGYSGGLLELRTSFVREWMCRNPYAKKPQLVENIRQRGYDVPQTARGRVMDGVADAIATAYVGQHVAAGRIVARPGQLAMDLDESGPGGEVAAGDPPAGRTPREQRSGRVHGNKKRTRG